MNNFLVGASVGAAVSLSLVAAEYFSVRAVAMERARRKRVKYQLDPLERERIASLSRFCVLVPPIFAVVAWAVWG